MGRVRTGEERLDEAVLGVEPAVGVVHVGRLGLARRVRRERKTEGSENRHV